MINNVEIFEVDEKKDFKFVFDDDGYKEIGVGRVEVFNKVFY